MSKRKNIIIAITGLLVLVFSLLVQTGVIKLVSQEDINPFLIEEKIDKSEVSWEFTETKETDGLTPPKSLVEVKIKNKNWQVGEYEGSCSVKIGVLLVNELSSATCSWRGIGVEIGLFIENQNLVLKKRLIQAQTEDNYNIVSDEFKIIKELDI
jgi:hypothetical protein